ncbi:MAG: hypothetical protein RLZZ241_2566, partial [Bacteroidota bacterium]
AYALDVTGTINASDILINGNPIAAGSSVWTQSGSNAYFNSGNIGIGNTNPATALDVTGTVTASNLSTAGNVTASGLSVSGNSTLSGTLSAGAVSASSLSTTGTLTAAGASVTGNGSVSGTLTAGTVDAGTLLVNGNPLPSSPFTINGAEAYYTGRIGIGNTNPNNAYALDVTGTINASDILIGGNALPTSPWTVTTGETYYSGRVGIGNTNPNNAYALDVTGTINASDILINGNPIAAGSSVWTQSGSNAYFNSGNIGIGTNAPAYALDVAGTINATGILVNGSPITTGGGGGSVWSLNGGGDAFYSTGGVAVGTNTIPAGFAMAVAGAVISEGVTVSLQGDWPDYVFDSEFSLPSLDQVARHIAEKGHLPNVPSADQIKKEGINLGEMNAILLQKIEELTLYALEQQKQIQNLSSENEQLLEKMNGMSDLAHRIKKLEMLLNLNNR